MIVNVWHFQGTDNGLHQSMLSRTSHDMFFRSLSSFHWQPYRQKNTLHAQEQGLFSKKKKKNLSIFLVYTKSKGHLSRISTRVFVYSQPSFHENKLIEHRPTAMHEVLSHVLCIIRLICTSRNNCTMFFFENTF